MLGRFLQKFVGTRANSLQSQPTHAANRAARKAKRAKKQKKDKFVAWLKENPEGTFDQFYVETVIAALDGKRNHASLGPTLKQRRPDYAQSVVDQWLTRGIEPSDTVVDYGCGTLRLGRNLIEFLDPDRYVGLDIDHRILAAGRSLLPADLLELKRPVLDVISAESLKRTSARKPKWVCSKGVLQHIPPAQIDKFFEDISHLILPGATGLIETQIRDASERLSSKTWAYCLADLQASAARSGMSLVQVACRYRKILHLSAATQQPVRSPQA
jgi:SAM-dependent methyltransferase